MINIKAFPYDEYQRGMNLRDYFAAKVMAASFYNPLEMTVGEIKEITKAAYIVADEMMKARVTPNE